MKKLPYEIKLTYIIVIIVMILFLIFIVFIILIYNRKQLLYIKEKQLKDSEYENQLLQKELEKQKSLENERLRISHDMHDEIGAGISAIKLQSEILKLQINNDKINTIEIDELIRISNDMNNSMREMLWSLNGTNDSFPDFSDYCRNYVENYFSKTNIQLTFSSVSENKDAIVKTELRRNLLLIIKEASHNIIKHSSASEVSISIFQQSNLLKLEIKDNGSGFEKTDSKGYGLTTMQSRTENMGGDFSIISDSSGTKINVSISL